MSSNLQTERKELCNKKFNQDPEYINECLMNKYNISYSQLCKLDELSSKDAWIPSNMPIENELTFSELKFK